VHRGLREVGEATRVVEVEMGEHDGAGVEVVDPHRVSLSMVATRCSRTR